MQRIIAYFREAWEELHKVVWPSREAIIRHTIIVILSITIAMLVIAAIDLVLTNLLQLITQRS